MFVRLFVQREISSSNMVWPRITNYYKGIQTDIVNSRTGYDVIIYSRSEVIAKKNCRKYHFATASGGISRERFKPGWPNFAIFSRTICLTNLSDMTPLATSGRLQNATKYWLLHKNAQKKTKSGRIKSRIIRPLFDRESPKLAGTSVPTHSIAIPDMTSPAAYGRHLSMFEKRPKMPHPTAIDTLH